MTDLISGTQPALPTIKIEGEFNDEIQEAAPPETTPYTDIYIPLSSFNVDPTNYKQYSVHASGGGLNLVVPMPTQYIKSTSDEGGTVNITAEGLVYIQNYLAACCRRAEKNQNKFNEQFGGIV